MAPLGKVNHFLMHPGGAGGPLSPSLLVTGHNLQVVQGAVSGGNRGKPLKDRWETFAPRSQL